MAKIPLRAYTKEIENLIDRGEIEPALAHARNILRAYPKHIETYRLLGKAFLESQRYGEAADILQRVLSVIPDDFVSQIGMSIIREDEGNLDAAIWHMERAYEVQPFNPAVQDELRRLYGRRDGVEPPKIRLTRGALVRMYTRGELYPQAIAETRAALAEDPQRFDLLVLLARLYTHTGQKNDAAEVCSELIAKLPYCYEANRLLAEILSNTSRADEAQKFLQRIYALNPYEAFVSTSAPTSEQVPDQAVMVEEFVWDADVEATQAPGWARTVGAAWDETEQEETLPDWLNTLAPDTKAAEAATPPMDQFAIEEEPAEDTLAGVSEGLQGAETDQEDLVPEWMKEAGWASTDRTADEIMAEQQEGDTEGELQPAEIPEWLQSMAPEGASDEDEEGRNDWLESILAPTETVEGAEQETPSTDEVSAVSAEEMEAFAAEMQDTTMGEAEQNVPDWLAGLESETLPQAGEGLPDWLSETEDAAALSPAEEIEAPGIEPPSSETLPEWAAAFEENAEPSAGEDTPDWLKSLESESGGAEAEIRDWGAAADLAPGEAQPTAEEESALAGEVPEWLQSLKEETTQAGEESELLAAETPAPSMEIEGDEELTTATFVETAETVDTGEPEAPAMIESALEAEAAEEVAAQEAPQSEAGPQDEAAPQSEAVAEGTPDFSDMDATMAWLEALAARQGAEEGTLITAPEQRSEEMPEWLRNETAQGVAAAEESGIAAESPAAIEEQPVEAEFEGEPAEEAQTPDEAVVVPQPETPVIEQPLPEWAAEEASPEAAAQGETTEEPRAEETSEVEAANEELLADLWAADDTLTTQPFEGAIEQQAESAPAEEAETPEFNIEDAMAWLESLAARQGADEETLTTAPEDRVETPPEWVQEMQDSEPTPAAAQEEAPAAAEIPEEMADFAQETAEEAVAPDWLKETTAQAEEAPLTLEETSALDAVREEPAGAVEEQPEASTEVPDWLAAESGEVVEAVPSAELEEENLPEWLKGLEEESEALSSIETAAAVESTDYHAAWEPELAQEFAAAEEPAETEPEPPDLIVELRKALDTGNLERAVEGYTYLIENNENLEEVIGDLRNALYRYPVDISLWQVLGDAYARNDQLQEALDAYTKAEELLR